MSGLIPAINREVFAQNFNKGREALNLTRSNEGGMDVFLACLNAYLFLCKDVGVPKEQYETVRKALQDITEWFIIGDIESFSFPENQETQKTIIKLG